MRDDKTTKTPGTLLGYSWAEWLAPAMVLVIIIAIDGTPVHSLLLLLFMGGLCLYVVTRILTGFIAGLGKIWRGEE